MKFHVLGPHTFINIGRALKFYMHILHEIPFLGRVNRFALSRIVSPLVLYYSLLLLGRSDFIGTGYSFHHVYSLLGRSGHRNGL